MISAETYEILQALPQCENEKTQNTEIISPSSASETCRTQTDNNGCSLAYSFRPLGKKQRAVVEEVVVIVCSDCSFVYVHVDLFCLK
jgi:hypothetical protein